MSRRQLKTHIMSVSVLVAPTPFRRHSPKLPVMLRKRRPENSYASDPNRCEQFQHNLYDQPSNDSMAFSKEAESRRWHKDSPRYCERVRRLVSPPQVRPRRCERTRQALRGIGRADDCRAQLMRTVTGIQRRQGEDRGSWTPT